MTKTYKAIQAIGGGKLTAVDLPLREPPAGHVRIRVEACGICHTDALTVEGASPLVDHPRVPGHEVVGRIDAVGTGVEDWSTGQRVGVGFLGGHCGTCSSCRNGDFVNCQRQQLSGVHYDGGYAEVMIAKTSGLVRMPADMDPVDAAPLLCAGVTTFNGLRKSKARAGDLVAIQGIGGLGHLGIQFAKYMGFKVAAIARDSHKAELAKALGAHYYIDSNTQDVAAQLQKLGGAQVILATAADSQSQSALVGGLAPGGELVVAGVGGDGPIAVSGMSLLFGEHSVRGTLTGSALENERALAFSALQGINAMTETAPLAQAAQTYAKMMSNAARFRMVLVTGQ